MVENDLKFPTLEHYLMYHKAKVMGDQEKADEILATKFAWDVKKLGRRVKNWDEELWKTVRFDIMYRGVKLKVDTYPDLKQSLMDTGRSVIAEASPYDSIWGIGAGRGATEWEGLNLLGEVWMQVRSSLIE